MPNISAWPNDARVSSLSDVLVKGPIPEKYFLSAAACAGILRRAAKRRRILPALLEAVLTAVATADAPKVPPPGITSLSTEGATPPN
jgi:hypothetical protein